MDKPAVRVRAAGLRGAGERVLGDAAAADGRSAVGEAEGDGDGEGGGSGDGEGGDCGGGNGGGGDGGDGDGSGATMEDSSRTRLYRELVQRKQFLARAAGEAVMAGQAAAAGQAGAGGGRGGGAHGAGASDGEAGDDEAKGLVAGGDAADGGECSMSAASSSSAFLASLNLVIQISPLSEQTAERAAQLTERTNQHNACRTIVSAAALLRLAAPPSTDSSSASPPVPSAMPQRDVGVDASGGAAPSPVGRGGGFRAPGLLGCVNGAPRLGDTRPGAHSGGAMTILTVRGRDRFGDHGLIGLIALDSEPSAAPGGEGGHGPLTPRDTLHVRAWLLSCRSLHIGIEFAMLRRAAEVARAAGACRLAVHWVRAERNEPAAAFLFSVPGARFVAATPDVLGLPATDSHAPVVDSRNGWIPGARSVAEPTPEWQAEATAAAAAAARVAAATVVAQVACAAEQPPVAAPGLPEGMLVWSAQREPAFAANCAAGAAVVAAIESICEAGAMLEVEALPPASVLCALPHLDRRRLVQWAAARVGRERRGCLQYQANRAAARFVIRGRVGGELCWQHAAGRRCASARCPFAHPMRDPVAARVRALATGCVAVTLALTASHLTTESSPGACPDAATALSGQAAGLTSCTAEARAGRVEAIAAALAEREAELLAERTFGDVARYESSVLARPPSGYILIDVDAAAAVRVRLDDGVRGASSDSMAGALSDGAVTHSDAAPTSNGATAAARSGAESSSGGGVAAGADSGEEGDERRGWAKNGCFVLHFETYTEIASWLSFRPGELHAWVASECERSRLVPQPYAEAWDLVLRREAELGSALAAAGGESCEAAGHAPDHEPFAQTGGEQARAMGSDADLTAERARLRRRIRHAMHLMMQQSNPHTYYAGVQHVCK